MDKKDYLQSNLHYCAGGFENDFYSESFRKCANAFSKCFFVPIFWLYLVIKSLKFRILGFLGEIIILIYFNSALVNKCLIDVLG